jgi:hypothetical protein
MRTGPFAVTQPPELAPGPLVAVPPPVGPLAVEPLLPGELAPAVPPPGVVAPTETLAPREVLPPPPRVLELKPEELPLPQPLIPAAAIADAPSASPVHTRPRCRFVDLAIRRSTFDSRRDHCTRQ